MRQEILIEGSTLDLRYLQLLSQTMQFMPSGFRILPVMMK